jgi:hypothetical protein
MTSAMTVHSHADSPSVVRHWLDKARRSIGLGSSHITHVAHHGLHSIQQYGEAGIVGALLGAANAELASGLDIQGKYPLDLSVAAAGLVLPLLPVDMLKGVAADARNAGSTAFGIYLFRQVDKLMRAKRAGVHGSFAGESSGDAVVDAARSVFR